ncbi:MAG TPA: gamma-glutamylcyclotransferase family protein [Solirubrobacteraceae bacterium]|nr:gamma-glutamylcyclotransferase family protein [Solirubrobacteraceae bacterium]
MRAPPATAHLAFYGTLMSGFDTLDELGVRAKLRLLGPCRIAGRLFDLGEWPTLVRGGGVAHGELFEILDASVFATLDPFEDYRPGDPARSSYLRVRVALLAPAVEAWVYVASETPPSAREITSGSWQTGWAASAARAKTPANMLDQA